MNECDSLLRLRDALIGVAGIDERVEGSHHCFYQSGRLIASASETHYTFNVGKMNKFEALKHPDASVLFSAQQIDQQSVSVQCCKCNDTELDQFIRLSLRY